MASFNKIKDKVLNGGGLFTFLRSSVAAQIASWTDMGIRMIFYSFVFAALEPFYRSNLSVAAGALVGGIVNCCINYRFTFHARGQSVKAIGVKYLLVWTGSLLLNMYGTTYMALLLSRWHWLINIGFKPDGIFAASTLMVSLIVSLAWNFVLQRNFVYRPSPFDRYAISFIDFFSTRKYRQDSDGNISNT